MRECGAEHRCGSGTHTAAAVIDHIPPGRKHSAVHLRMHHAPSWENTDKPAAAWLPARQIHSLNKSRLGRGHIADLYSSTHTLPEVNLHGVR